MRKAKRTILIFVLVCAFLLPVCYGQGDAVLSGRDLLKAVREKDKQDTQPPDNDSAPEQEGAQPNEPADNIDSVKDAATESEPETVDRGGKTRVVHFPKNRSLGRVVVRDADIPREIKGFIFWGENVEKWDYHGLAEGDVVIPAGKRVKLITSWNRKPDSEDLAKLRVDDLHLLAVQCGMDNRLRADNSYLESVGRLTGLKALDISESNITSRGLFKIRNLEQLERLRLGEGITNSGVRVVANLKSLKGLYLIGCRITDAGLAKLCENLSLEELALWDKNLSNEGLAHLSKIGTLRYLFLQGDNFTDAGMAHLKDVPSLRILNAAYARRITDAGVKHLSKHPGLERITFHGNGNITNEGAKFLGQMRSLKRLDVRSSHIDDVGVGYLSKCKTLEEIILPSTGITDIGLKHLSTIDGLKALNVSGSYTDEGLRDIGKLTELEELNIGGIGVTDAGMEHVSKLRKLKRLVLHGCPVTDKGLEKLTALKSLEHLVIFESKITISGLKSLNKLPDMKRLNLEPVIQDHSIMDLSGLQKLEKLTIGTPHKSPDVFVDADLACLSQLKNLKCFTLKSGKIGITDEGMKHLAGLTSMEDLHIGGSKLTDDSLKYLSSMKKLQRLGLFGLLGGNLTDNGLRHLEGCRSLQSLRIHHENDITDEALGRLRAKLPNIYTIKINRNEKKRKKK